MDMDSAYTGGYIEPPTWAAIYTDWPNFNT